MTTLHLTAEQVARAYINAAIVNIVYFARIGELDGTTSPEDVIRLSAWLEYGLDAWINGAPSPIAMLAEAIIACAPGAQAILGAKDEAEKSGIVFTKG